MARILATIGAAIGTTIVGVAVALIPLSAGALGLGEIDLQSALNQPFSAEIPIAVNAPGELDGLHVEIASAQTFQQFGLDRAAFLSGFQFAVVARGDAAVVQITSQQPVVEPFVTLLLEISWGQGRLLREYTVLLDPPVFATESVQPAVAAPTAGPTVSTPIRRDESTPEQSTDTQVTDTQVIGTQAPRTSSPAVQPVARSAANSSDGLYGPVQRTDTLWGIAGRLTADSPSVSRNQMMLAIYQANPEAFSGNINRLKAGMILRLPSVNEVVIGGREATREVRRQNEQWRSASAVRDEQQGGRLRLVPPSERDAEAAESGIQTGSAQAANEQASADRAAASRAQDALQERVGELEGELAASRQQLQVRDRELAALQRQLAGIETRQEVVPAIDEPQSGADEAEAPLAADLLAESAAEAAAQADTEDQAATPAPIDVTPVPAERADDDSLLSNPLVYIALAIFVLLGWLFARNRSKSAEPVPGRWDELDAGMAAAGPGEEVHEATTRLHAAPPVDDAFVVEEAPSPDETADEDSAVPLGDGPTEGLADDWGDLSDEGETPLERTISTDAAVNLDQADPLAESDFHMAYGLYDQAADLLTRTIESEPERQDLRMKLLEVYFIWEHQDDFLREARALEKLVDDAADPGWNKVLIMGKQICPDEALFAGATAPIGSADDVDLEFSEDSSGTAAIDIALDDDGVDSSVDLQFDDEAAADLDLDLSGETPATDEDPGMIDFEIDSEEEATQVVGDDGLEIPGDTPTLETPTVESPAVAGTLETPTLEAPALQDSESTVETPTIESPAGSWESDSGENDPGDNELATLSEQTAEINLDDLDLDLSGLDDLDGDVLDEDSGTVQAKSADVDLDLEFDVSDDETRQQAVASFDDIPDAADALDELADDVDRTAEMQNLDAAPGDGDTVEQPTAGGGDTAEQPNLTAVVDDDEIRVEAQGAGIESATMTEVGTKLDLARAYIDMGDPDGARSILSEVLEEADADQKQLAQKLLEDLAD